MRLNGCHAAFNFSEVFARSSALHLTFLFADCCAVAMLLLTTLHCAVHFKHYIHDAGLRQTPLYRQEWNVYDAANASQSRNRRRVWTRLFLR